MHKPKIKGKNTRKRQNILTRKATNSFNKHLSRFRQNRHRRKANAQKQSAGRFYDFKRSERSRGGKNQTQSDVPSFLPENPIHHEIYWNLKCYWDTKEEWQLLFAPAPAEARPWTMENRNVIKSVWVKNSTWNFHQISVIPHEYPKLHHQWRIGTHEALYLSSSSPKKLHRLIKIPFQQNDYVSLTRPASNRRHTPSFIFLITTLLVLLLALHKTAKPIIFLRRSITETICFVYCVVFCFPNL